jgi:hypothetical protein
VSSPAAQRSSATAVSIHSRAVSSGRALWIDQTHTKSSRDGSRAHSARSTFDQNYGRVTKVLPSAHDRTARRKAAAT